MIVFDDQFEVPAEPDAVMQRFMDVDAIARCVPGVTLDGQDEQGNYLGTMTVAFGPKRLKFQGRMKCEFDAAARTGVLSGGGAAAGRSAQVQMNSRFSVVPAGAGRSRVEIASRTEMHGVLAQFATAGGAAVAKQLMEEFANNLSQALAAPVPTQNTAPGAPPAAPQALPRAAELSAGRMLWRMFLARLRGWGLLPSAPRGR
ncbi:SRPBCC domain-containing protein [Hydrogenophaga sp.]|uniref:SRPBCC domain-containing protein n=1 Tax=Hydrogenophaga sp. TaxID=1904254 RepID=UPI002718E5A6|nr:SRPBCC domain-containing protein [Hydrogenophaga sp.]MDO9435743.1 SRPBCC domain-containing protein [Hydrogenophaga sp.]